MVIKTVEVKVFKIRSSYLLTMFKVPDMSNKIYKAGCSGAHPNGRVSQELIMHIGEELISLGFSKDDKQDTSTLVELKGDTRIVRIDSYLMALKGGAFTDDSVLRDFIATQILLGM